MKNTTLYITVFISGMATLGIEFAASRLLGAVFGTSNIVWASIIGLILIYLTLGYFIGGKWADRSPYPESMYKIIGIAAVFSGIVPFIAQPILRLAADAFDQLSVGLLFGSFSVVLILFSVPVTLLGTVSPYAIRLSIQDTETAGAVAGRMYAISTLGSFIGTFLPVLVIIPLLGTTMTFVIFSLSLVVVAVGGLWIVDNRKWALVFLAAGALILVYGFIAQRQSIKATVGQIYETESAYNYIQVLEQDGYHYLRLNEGQGIHSVYKPDIYTYYGPWMQVLAAPYFNPAPYDETDLNRVAIIGLAAGTIANQLTHVFGPVQIDGYEIDPKIIAVGETYFGMDMPNLNSIAIDGRWGLDTSEYTYSVISIDAYRPPYIPWHLTTREFFQSVRNHLTDDGVLVINVGRAPGDRRLINDLVATMRPLFASIHVMDIPDTFNSMIYATAAPTTTVDLYNNYVSLVDEGAKDVLLQAIERVMVYEQEVPSDGIVFTDDLAPIEWITNDMVLSYVLSSGLEELK